MIIIITAKTILDVARGWLGYSEANGLYKEIMVIYNSHKPLAGGYSIKSTDDWCDTFVSAVAIKANATDLIGTEVGVERHVAIFKEKGIWIEDGTTTPKEGDIIVFNWKAMMQPNDGFADHIGFVERVDGSFITTIEGNNGETVARRQAIPIGWKFIRGFARPRYDKETEDIMDISKLTDTEVDALLVRIATRLAKLPTSPYAIASSKKGIATKIFSDGNFDGLVDAPQGFLTREQLAVILNNAGIFDFVIKPRV